ncbi:hypothetical protein TNCV_521011, partial [Trichonephila clavipes]
EAHFWLNGYVNKQKHLGEANPRRVCRNTPLNPETDCLVRFLWAGGILLQSDEGTTLRKSMVMCDRYIVEAMITNFFIPELNNHDASRSCGSTRRRNCRTKALATIDLLKDTLVVIAGPQ